MSSLTRWVLAHKRIVVAFWLVVTIAGIGAAGPAADALSDKFNVPGKEAWIANGKITSEFRGTGGENPPLVPVVTLPSGTTVDSPGVKAKLAAVDAKLEKALPGARIASYASTGNRGFVSKDGRTTFVLAYPTPDPNGQFGQNKRGYDHALAALKGVQISGAPFHLTGYDALQQQSGGSDGPGVLLEAVLGGLGALAVLVFVFASFLALVPMLVAIVSIFTTFLLVYGLTGITDISVVVQFLIALVGLGIAIDYALIIVVRWREERSNGREGEAAVQKAMETAGRAVVFSGTTVAIGLLALVALPLPFLRSMGYAGLLIPLVSTLVAITLLPVVLAKWGARLDWPHRRTDQRASAAWTSWARLIVRHRALAATVAIIPLALLIIAAGGLRLGTADADSLAKPGDAKNGLVALERSGLGTGTLLPHEVVVQGAQPQQVADALAKVRGVQVAFAPDEWRKDGVAVVDAVTNDDTSTQEGRDALDNLRDAAHDTGSQVRVGGILAGDKDFIDAVYGNFPLMIALITVVTFILLARAFRSLLLPLKAVLLNIISVLAAWGVLVLVWQHGHGSDEIWGVVATGSVPSWIPLMVFAFLYGLSMDYEVFILSRMREEYDRTGSTEEAVITGIGRTGRLVTSAALILFLAFTAMASGPDTQVRMLATGLAAGILLDATVIRALLVPAVISIMGRWNWWLPERPARWLRVKPSELRPRRVATESD
jgi:putative drug exporter of the RND superfamily